jgi:hypothetical protein
MKLKTGVILVLLLWGWTANVVAQQATNAMENTETLRMQLLEVESKQQQLRMRLQLLDENLKPENIERALVGIGSTRPEDLRASRRDLLTIERDGVVAQLKILEASHARLEAEIASAEVQAYLRLVQTPPPAANHLSLFGSVQPLCGQIAKWYGRTLVSASITLALLVVATVVITKARFFCSE